MTRRVRAARFGAVRYADRVGLCKTSLFIIPVEGKELCRARTVLAGAESAAAQMVMSGLQPLEEDQPCPPVPQLPWAFPALLLEVEPRLGEPSEGPAPSYSLAQRCQGLCSPQSCGQCHRKRSTGNTAAASSSITSTLGISWCAILVSADAYTQEKCRLWHFYLCWLLGAGWEPLSCSSSLLPTFWC